MPSSKIIYATSDACMNVYPDNTYTDFTFVIDEPLTLSTPGQLLTVRFQGVYIPGQVTNAADGLRPRYIKIQVDQLEFQRSASYFDQCLARIPIDDEANPGFVELPDSKEITLLTNSLSQLRIKLTNEWDNALAIRNPQRKPTIVKLEVSSVDMEKETFTITCSSGMWSDDECRYEHNTINGFNSWLARELDLTGRRYQVGLSAAVFPKQIFACYPKFNIIIQRYFPSEQKLKKLVVNIPKIRDVTSFNSLLNILNHAINKHGFPVCIQKNQNGLKLIAVNVKSMRHVLDLFAKGTARVKNWERLTKDVVTVMDDEAKENCLKKTPCEIKVKISRGLMFLLTNKHVDHDCTLADALGAEEILHMKNGFNPDISKHTPNGISVFSPIVTSTILGKDQKNLLEIIPFKQNVGWKHIDDDDKYLYHPQEITYRDVEPNVLKEISFSIRNMDDQDVLQSTNPMSPVLLILHFRPAE